MKFVICQKFQTKQGVTLRIWCWMCIAYKVLCTQCGEDVPGPTLSSYLCQNTYTDGNSGCHEF